MVKPIVKASRSTVAKFMSDLVIYTKYANYMPEYGRRQNWDECVDVVKNMHVRKYPHLESKIVDIFDNYVKTKKVLPSMRSIQFGGLPIELANNRIYNCAYVAVDSIEVFSEAMFSLLCGTGIGYSVCRRDVYKLPNISYPKTSQRYKVGDSIEGWADSIKALMEAYMCGKPLPRFDYRDIRPAGSIIKKTGGIAPGPDKLKKAHENINSVLQRRVNNRLDPTNAHDIMCYIADCVLSGGIREAAMIALFDKDDAAMMNAKSSYMDIDKYVIIDEVDGDGSSLYIKLSAQPMYNTIPYPHICDNDDQSGFIYAGTYHPNDYMYDMIVNKKQVPWYVVHPQRARANNSVKLHRDTTTREEFDIIWDAVKNSGSGEPGIFWVHDVNHGTNPCAEIMLKNGGTCNLTSIVTSDIDTQEELEARARAAAFIGTLQAGYSDFHYLSRKWIDTNESERLLGVSQTGITTGKVMSLDMNMAAAAVKAENSETAAAIGITPATRLTCIKPEGTGTLAAGVQGSGIHAVHSEFYIRNIRIKKSHGIYAHLKNVMPDFIEDDAMNDERAVVSIPIKAPDGSITRNESALDLLERIKYYRDNWIVPGHNCDEPDTHNVSATVTVKDDEWDVVAEWMWDNRDSYNGISVLPYDGGTYKQAPFIEITEQEYYDMLDKFPIQAANLLDNVYEQFIGINHASDNLACAGGSCEI